MDLQEFKKQQIQQVLNIPESFGRICTFIDFGNVNYWFADDTRDENDDPLLPGQQLRVDLAKLREFTHSFSMDTRFYYGHDARKPESSSFIRAARYIFGSHRVFTKPIQFIRHHLTRDEIVTNSRTMKKDSEGSFIEIPKCNFDVEICVDAVRLLSVYDTICLLSGDADFVHLLRYLRKSGKKTILIKGGHVLYSLAQATDLMVNAQDIKRFIAIKKQEPDLTAGLADR